MKILVAFLSFAFVIQSQGAGRAFNLNCQGASADGHTALLQIHGTLDAGRAVNGAQLITSTLSVTASTGAGLVKVENIVANGQLVESQNVKMNLVGAKISSSTFTNLLFAFGERGNSLTLENEDDFQQIEYTLDCKP